jgi:hypothetical protein
MNNTFSISAVLSVLTGLLLLSVWGNIHAYAQPSSSALAADSSSTMSPQVKAIMCDPSNPSLKVVNTTEAHICGIPKTVKPSLSSSTPPTSAVSSTTATTHQTTKPSLNPIVATPSKQQETTPTSNNVAEKTRLAPIRVIETNPATKQLSSTTTTIAPQAIHQQQQQQQEQQPQPQILPLTATSNNTITLNNTLSTASPLLGPGQLTFLGFHGSGSSSRSDNGDGSGSSSSHSSSSSVKHSSDTKSSSSSKDKHSSDTKSSSSSKDKHSSDTKSTHSHSTSSSSSHAKSSGHSDHGSKSTSNAGSSIGDQVRSIIKHALD